MAQVTIGLPVYNGEKYLEQALESLCSQTFMDMKIIISDNCSTDSTPEIIKKWSRIDSRIAVTYRQPENIGALANFEWVLKKADTSRFMFAAHDDSWSSDYVEKLYNVSIQDKGIKLSVPYVVYTDEGGREVGSRKYPQEIDSYGKLKRISHLISRSCGSWFYGMYERKDLLESWEKNKDFKYPWGQDLLILLPFLLSGQVAGCNDVQYICRIRNSSSENYKPKGYDEQKKFIKSYLSHVVYFLKCSDLTVVEKFILFPQLVRFVNDRGFKFRRLIRSAFKEAIKKSAND